MTMSKASGRYREYRFTLSLQDLVALPTPGASFLQYDIVKTICMKDSTKNTLMNIICAELLILAIYYVKDTIWWAASPLR